MSEKKLGQKITPLKIYAQTKLVQGQQKRMSKSY